MRFEDIVQLYKENKDLLFKAGILILIFIILLVFHVAGDSSAAAGVTENKSGELISVTRPPKGQQARKVNAKAKIKTKNGTVEKNVVILIKPTGAEIEDAAEVPEESESDKIDRQLNQLVSEINRDATAKKIILPGKLDSGEPLVWQRSESSNLLFYIVALILSLFAIYRNKFAAAEKKKKQEKASIIQGLPAFTNKMVLLLNAGMVTSRAFMKIIEDYETTSQEKTYFYVQLGLIYQRIKKTNSVLQDELKEFSRLSGVPELMRVSHIINDNMNKGTELVEKLQKENAFLWFARKKLSEEKGRLAETKLTVPLVILLAVLVMVTVAPAMMGM